MSGRADVVIVGGGIIGCSLAAELARRGHDALVLERAEPGAEASGAAAGMLTPQSDGHPPGPFFDLALESRGLYADWARSLVEQTGMDVGYRETGAIRCAFDDADAAAVSESAGWQRARGLRVEEGDPSSLPAPIARRLSARVRRVFAFPDEGSVDPRRLTRAVWLSAESRGARVRTGVAARRFIVERGVCRGVETDAGVYESAAVVDAAGAWARFDGQIRIPIPVEPVRGQIVELRLDGEPLAPIVSSREVYLVSRADGSALVGSTLERCGFQKAVTASAVSRLLARVEELVPSAASAHVLGAWAGLRPGTPDGLPVLGATPVAGLFLASGHYRNGILLAPATALRMADLIVEGRGVEALAPFSVDRFAPAPADGSGRPARGDRVFG